MLEPGIAAGGCVIAGARVSLSGDSLELCGAPGRACFGSLRSSSAYMPISVLRLEVGPSLAAHLIVGSDEVLVSAVVDARGWAPHPRAPELVEGWFVPQWATLTFRRVHDHAAVLAVELGADVSPASALVIDWTCDRLTNESPTFTRDDVVAAASIGAPAKTLVAPATGGVLEVRSSPRGPILGSVRSQGQEVTIHGESGTTARALIAVDGGWVIGWTDASRLSLPSGRGHRTRRPTLRMEPTSAGLSCPHDVAVRVGIGDDVVHAATIRAGTRFDPREAAEPIRRLGIALVPQARAHVAEEQLTDCHE